MMSGGDWAGVLIAIVGILGAIAGGLKLLFNQFNGIISELRAQLAVALVQIQSKQDSIDELYKMNADCEAEAGETYGWMAGAHGWMMRHKHDDEDVPSLPPRRPRMIERAAYIQRRAQQNTNNSIKAVSETLPPAVTKIIKGS
jgi:hypothetical protein